LHATVVRYNKESVDTGSVNEEFTNQHSRGARFFIAKHLFDISGTYGYGPRLRVSYTDGERLVISAARSHGKTYINDPSIACLHG